jgi:hypothetical protein
MTPDTPINPEEGEQAEGWAIISRRTLLKAGWTAPVILTVAPAVAFAASGLTSPQGSASVPQSKPRANTSSGGTTQPTSGATGAAGGATSPAASGTGNLPQQQSEGPEPARINRGFTG